ncbi:MAG: hypothetical protein ACM3NS_00755 [Deltaproteobacteria bacterium]
MSGLACSSAEPVAPAAPSAPAVVHSVALTAAADTVPLGQRVLLTAIISADGALSPADIRWSVAPAATLKLSPDHRAGELAADRGTYEVTVQAGDKTGRATVTALAFAPGSPLPGSQWRLVALQLQADSGGDPEPVPFVSGSMTVDSAGPIHIELACAGAYYNCDGPGNVQVWDYPFVQSYGSVLLLCVAPDDQVCGRASWVLDGNRLSMIGPETDLPFETVWKHGIAEWTFERQLQ